MKKQITLAQYQIVSGDISEVETQVKNLLNQGWECQGGVVYAWRSGCDDQNYYSQGMIKPATYIETRP